MSLIPPKKTMQDFDNRSYHPDYYSPFLRIEKKHFWFRARNSAIASLTRRAITEFKPGYRVLEGGCGTGNVLNELSQVCEHGKVYGLDLYREGFLQSIKNSKIGFIQGDIVHPPFSSAFDLIGLFDIIEHITDDIQLLKSIYYSLGPNGKLLLTVPAHMYLWSYFDEAYFHRRRYSVKELCNKLKISGYTIDYISEFMSVSFPFIWLTRRVATLFNYCRKKPENDNYEMAKKELVFIPILNELFYLSFFFEKFLIKMNIKIPFGSSIIVLASKKSCE